MKIIKHTKWLLFSLIILIGISGNVFAQEVVIPATSVNQPTSVSSEMVKDFDSTKRNLFKNLTKKSNINFEASLNAPKIAILGTIPFYDNDVKSKLDGTGYFSQTDVINVRESTPTLAQMQQYDAVIVYSDGCFQNSTVLGNNLADYVDSGGGVVVATFAFYDSDTCLAASGRLSSGGYLPFTRGSYTSGSELFMVKDDASHPILNGVNTFSGGTASYHNSPISLASGATLIAHWTNGQPLVGTKITGGNRVVGLNFYPPSSDIRSDFWRSNTDGAKLMGNALLWAALSNTAPLANADSFSTNEDTMLSDNVLTNDTDAENNSLTATLVSGPSSAASFTLNSDGSFSYTPAANFNGSDSFTYKANDGSLDSETVTVTISVNAVNDAPAISGTSVTRQQGTPGTVSTIATVSDEDNSAGSLTVSVTSLPQGISVTGITNNNGTITATVTADCSAAVGANNVGLKVTDSEGAMGTGTLTVNVTKETTPPVIDPIANVTVQLPPNSNATSMPVSFPLPTATDNCGAPVTVTTNPPAGSEFPVGTTTVQVTATDQAGNQSTASFTVTVLYRFSMFYYSNLLLSEQVFNQVTAGNNVPIRFTLSGYKGDNPYSQPPTSQQISCTTFAPIGASQTIDRYAPDPYYASLYDFYQTTWRTQTSWKNTCRRLTLYLNDGTTRKLDFYFK